MKLVATSIAALGLMAAPLAAQEATSASQAPQAQTAGVVQHAEFSQASIIAGVPPLLIGGVVVAVVIGGAIAISQSGDDATPSTPGTQ